MFDCRSKTTQAFFYFNFLADSLCAFSIETAARVIIWIEESLCVMGGVEAPCMYVLAENIYLIQLYKLKAFEDNEPDIRVKNKRIFCPILLHIPYGHLIITVLSF